MQKDADWFSWILHFIVGLIVGIFFGFCCIVRRRHGIWLSHDLILPFLLGFSLVCAGLASRFGDKFWMGNNYRLIPPDGIPVSRFSIVLSWLAICLGVFLVLFALLTHFQIFPSFS